MTRGSTQVVDGPPVETGPRLVPGAPEHRFERELDARAQSRLVALQIRLGLARERAEKSAPAIATLLAKLADQGEAVGEELRRIACGVLAGRGERIALLGGRLEVSSSVGRGTNVAAAVPWPARTTNAARSAPVEPALAHG